ARAARRPSRFGHSRLEPSNHKVKRFSLAQPPRFLECQRNLDLDTIGVVPDILRRPALPAAKAARERRSSHLVPPFSRLEAQATTGCVKPVSARPGAESFSSCGRRQNLFDQIFVTEPDCAAVLTP